MASLKLLAASLLLVATAVVQGCPTPKTALQCRKPSSIPVCNELIIDYFEATRGTVCGDYEWIKYQIEFIKCKSGVPEYQPIIELWILLEKEYGCFDNGFGKIRGEIDIKIEGYISKYNPLGFEFGERIISLRRCMIRDLYPNLCKFRKLYLEILALLRPFYDKHNCHPKPRYLQLPRHEHYNRGCYFPDYPSLRPQITSIYRTCLRDRKYLIDLIEALSIPEGSPDWGCREGLLKDIWGNWGDYDRHIRHLDIDFYPRFMDCGDDQDRIRDLYLEYIRCLKIKSRGYGIIEIDILIKIRDLYGRCKRPFSPIDWLLNEKDMGYNPALYLGDNGISKYLSNLICTIRADFNNARRIWDELPCEKGSPEWDLRQKMLADLRNCINGFGNTYYDVIFIIFEKLKPCWHKHPDVLLPDTYNDLINEILRDCYNKFNPILYQFRNNYILSDDQIGDLIKKYQLPEVPRNFFSYRLDSYSPSIGITDDTILGHLGLLEKFMKGCFHNAFSDLIPLQCTPDSPEWTRRRRGLEILERDWLKCRDIHKIIERKFIIIVVEKGCSCGTPDYDREIELLRKYCIDEINRIIDCLRKDIGEIDGIITDLYTVPTVVHCYKRTWYYRPDDYNIECPPKRCGC